MNNLHFQTFPTPFFLHSHKDAKWISDVFMKNKKKRKRRFDLERDHGFKFIIHERDWIAANIMDSLEKSRRVIFIVSRSKHVLLFEFFTMRSNLHLEPEFTLRGFKYFKKQGELIAQH